MIKYLFVLFTFVVWGCDEALLGDEGAILTFEENIMPPVALNDGLEVSSLREEGIDTGRIQSLISFLQENQSLIIRSLLIARNDKLVLESYFHGWNRDRKQDLRSSTKSMTSALVGIAIDKGYITNVNQPILSFFNEYESLENPDDRKEKMTIKDFLRMRTGLFCNDWNINSPGHQKNMYVTEDWVKFILDLPVARPPGESFSYCTAAPVTLGVIISKTSGKPIPDFAHEYLFGPLKIEDYNWEYMPNGMASAGGQLHMTPRSMVKFGLLFLNKGRWKGQQLVSEEWVEESTMPNGLTPSHGLEYGYLWWAKTWGVGTREIPSYFARGNGGQIILVLPDLDAVVVFTGGHFDEDWLAPRLTIINRDILPSFTRQ